MEFIYDDGGRSKYFKGKNVGDCVTRAIAIATGIDYKVVYDNLKQLCKNSKKYGNKSTNLVRQGTPMPIVRKYLEEELGWIWVATMDNKSKKRVHLVESEIPNGIFIARLSKHLVCVKDKVIYDTYNSSESSYYGEYGDIQINNERCIYGYWVAPNQQQIEEKERLSKLKEIEDKYKLKIKLETKKIKDKYQKKIKELEKLQNKQIKDMIKKLENQMQNETNNL